MSKFTGRLEEIGIGKEASRGTGVAPTYWIPKTSVSFDDKVNKALVVGSYGNITDAPMTAYNVEKWAEGNIEGEINCNSFGLLLLALLGTSTPTGPTETVTYSHAYTLTNTVTNQSLSLQIHDSNNQDIRFRLAMLNSLTINVDLGEVVKFSANFISKMHQDVAAGTPAYAIDYRFVSPDLTFKVANEVGEIAAATKISVKSLSLTIEKKVIKLPYLGTLEPEDVVNTGLSIKGSIELDYDSVTWKNYMLNNTTKAMQILLQSNKLLGSTVYPSLNMIFPKVHFTEWEKDTGLDNIASQTINFQVFYDLANTRLWSTFALINSVASY